MDRLPIEILQLIIEFFVADGGHLSGIETVETPPQATRNFGHSVLVEVAGSQGPPNEYDVPWIFPSGTRTIAFPYAHTPEASYDDRRATMGEYS